MAKIDTIREYYRPLALAENVGNILFWLVAFFSAAPLFFFNMVPAYTSDILNVAIIICVLLFFLNGLVLRLYLFPRAEDQRRKQLLSDSFGVLLSHEQTDGYYNNDQKNPIKRLSASVMESSFFTYRLSKLMLVSMRVKTFLLIGVFFLATIVRSTELEALSVAAQTLFGGEIVTKWVRLEWLRSRSEMVFNNLNRLFVGKTSFNKPAGQSDAIDQFAFYETTKAAAATLISTNLFRKNNECLSQEWEQIRLGLRI